MNDTAKDDAPVPGRALLISSAGVVLKQVEYDLPDVDSLGPPRNQLQRAVCGSSAIQAYLAAEDELDVLLLTTPATDPISEEVVSAKQGWTASDTQNYSRTAVQRMEDDLFQMRRQLGLERTPRVRRHRIAWEQHDGALLVEQIVNLPPLVEHITRRQFGHDWEEYDRILLDVAGGLRPLGFGLWLTAAYLMEARSLSRQTTAFYMEMEQADSPVFFAGALEGDRRPSPYQPTDRGRLIDLTPFFQSLAATVAVSHLARHLDFRGALKLVSGVAGAEVVTPKDFKAFATAAQLGLDLEAVALARRLETGAEDEAGATGHETLAAHLVGEVVGVGRGWARRHEGLDLPAFKKNKGTVRLRNKKNWPLGREEVARQVDLVEQLLEHGRLSDASLHIREFVVTALQAADERLGSNEIVNGSWLARRRDDDQILSKLAYLARDRNDIIQRGGKQAWGPARDIQLLGKLRNSLAHAGRRAESFDPEQMERDIRKCWDRFRPADQDLPSDEALDRWLRRWPSLMLKVARHSGAGFINLSKSPSGCWPGRQRAEVDGMGLGAVVDWDGELPSIDPADDSDEVEEVAKKLAKEILAHDPAAVHLDCEVTLLVRLVDKLRFAGVRCFAATTKGLPSGATPGSDAQGQAAMVQFVRWREYV